MLSKIEPGSITVANFMSRNVLKVYSHSNIINAIKVMAENNVGSVVVIDSAGPRGVFTERDLLSKILARGRDRENSLVMEVLSPLFVAVDPEATLVEAARTMVDKNSRLMVFEGGDLEGIVTATDIVRCIQRLSRAIDLTRVITRSAVTELPQTPLRIVVQDMDKRHIGSVLVAEDDAPYGIFTERDLLLKVLVRRISLETVVGKFASVPLVTAAIGIDGVEAAKIMVAKSIKRLPLKEGNNITGIVTARDIVEAFARSN